MSVVVERFRQALMDRGLQLPHAGRPDSTITGLEQDLMPLRLPQDLRELWLRVPVGALPLGLKRQLHDRALLVARDGLTHRFVELDAPGR